MKIGVALNMPADPPRNDAEVLREHLALGDMVEPLGFDSLFALEHHFTDYVLSPDPLQLLTYFAGRTHRIELGTAVAVLPLQNPIRLAEQIAILDVLSNGRCLFAFGRGSAASEFRGFGISTDESRQRFQEAASVLVGLLSQSTFQHSGKYFQIPPLSLRPVPVSSPHQRFFGAARSTESIELMAGLGFGLLVSTQKDWSTLGDDLRIFHAAALNAGAFPRRPIVLAMLSVDRSREAAFSRALKFFRRDLEFGRSHYGGAATAAQGMTVPDISDIAANQIVGTPTDCVEQIVRLVNLTAPEHLLLEFSYGGMPQRDAVCNLQVFAREVLPRLRAIGDCVAASSAPLLEGDSRC